MRIYLEYENIVKQLFESGLNYDEVRSDIKEEEIVELINIATGQKMLNVIYNVLIRMFPENSYLKTEFTEHKIYLVNTLIMIKKVINILNDGKYDYCIIKGTPLSIQIYDDPLVRNMYDIDIIVRESELKEIYTKLKQIGYFQVDNMDSNEPIVYFNDAYFEVKLVTPNPWEFPKVELKWGSSAFGKQDIAWLDNIEILELDGCHIKTQSKIYALIHMFANTFKDNEDRIIFKGNIMRNYFDLAFYLEYRLKDDFEDIVKVAKSLKCSRKVYSVLYSLNQLFHFRNFDINQAIELSKSEALLYPKRMPVFTESDDFMRGSQVPNNIVRTNAKKRIHDRDFAYYEYVKNHKLTVFSRLNQYYLSRKIIMNDEFTEWMKYDYLKGVYYRYYNSNDYIKVECMIDRLENDKFTDKFGIMLILINSNCFVPTLYDEFCMPISKEEFSNQKVYSTGGMNEYSDVFIDRHKDLFIEAKVYGSMRKEKDSNTYTFCIEKDSVLIEHNTLLFEFKLYRIQSNGHHTNMASRQEIIEFS